MNLFIMIQSSCSVVEGNDRFKALYWDGKGFYTTL